MENIYIATTTLNFNNIMATESISPKTFYKHREFGYKRFENIETNPFKNCIIGYSKIPKFVIKDKDLDNYPLIIEISKDLIAKKIYFENEIDGITVYQFKETIYLHPSKVKILFFDDKEKDICLIKANPSIETKLLPLYELSMRVLTKEDKSFQWNNSILKNIKDIDTLNIEKEVDKDLELNQIKGFYFGYELGILLSIKQKNKKAINTLIEELNKSKESIHNSKALCNKYIEENLDMEYHINFKDNRLNKLEDNIFKKPLTISTYQNIVNMLLKKHISSTQIFLEQRINLIHNIGGILQKSMPKNWETSGIRDYLNGLLDNIEDYKPFNINSKNELLQSIAIFILKGENLEKLFESLKINNIDYRIAFGLWGATFGFSSIPKTVSNTLFEKDNIKKTEIFYKDVQSKLHQQDIDVILHIKPILKSEVLKVENEEIKKDINLKEIDKFSFRGLYDSIYQLLKKCGGKSKITDLRQKLHSIKNKNNIEIKDLLKEDSRFKFYKSGRADYIEISDLKDK